MKEKITKAIPPKREIDTSYRLAPSISKTRVVNGKTYHITSYFAGDKDFEEIMIRLAIKHYYEEEAKKLK